MYYFYLLLDVLGTLVPHYAYTTQASLRDYEYVVGVEAYIGIAQQSRA